MLARSVFGKRLSTRYSVSASTVNHSAQGEAKPEWWIFSQLAARLGIPGFDFESDADVFNELCSVSPIYKGLDWDRIEDGEYQWPVPEEGHPGTPVLRQGEFKNGRGIFTLKNYRDPAEVVDAEYPIWLTTGRRLEAYHTRTQSGRAEGIDYLLPEETLEVHHETMKALGLTDGGMAKMRSRRGSVKVKAESTEQSPRGTVFCSFSFNDVPINALTGSRYDPITETAELKVCAVHIEPL